MRKLLLITVCAGGALTGLAQEPVPQIRTETRLVEVPALVVRNGGGLDSELTAADFVVTDNGVPQQVALEGRSSRPTAILVLEQTGGAATEQFASYRTLDTMLEYAGANSEVKFGLMAFDSQPEGFLRFSNDLTTLRKTLVKPERGDHGAAILDAVYAGAGWLGEQPEGTRRIIVLLSQKRDQGSKVKADDLLRRLSETNTEVYSLTFSPEVTWVRSQMSGSNRHENPPYKFSPIGPTILHTFDLGTPLGMAWKAMQEDAAEEIANLSGGMQMRFDTKEELEKQMASLANYLPNRYVLTFRPTSKDTGLHRLEVRVKGHADLTVHARSGYWVEPTTIEK